MLKKKLHSSFVLLSLMISTYFITKSYLNRDLVEGDFCKTDSIFTRHNGKKMVRKLPEVIIIGSSKSGNLIFT